MFAAWAEYIAQGGAVMGPLVAGTLLLWFCLGWRVMTLRRGSLMGLRALTLAHLEDPARPARGIIGRAAKITAEVLHERRRPVEGLLEEAFQGLEDEMRRFSAVITALVAAAPLTGLLGTVGGMIETFDSLADQSLFSQSGGIAGGISQALITTQMGLVIAIPGLIVGRVLDRKEAKLLEELDALRHVAVTLEEVRP